MADEFRRSVEFGLKLSERIYYGKEPSMRPPKLASVMEKSPAKDHLPTAPMVYAVISNPSIVDNPDIPSYQPYVLGKCQPPALIPLHMHEIEVDVDCYFDTAFVTVTGTWRVHCIAGNKSCDCRIAIPMGEQVVLFSLRFCLWFWKLLSLFVQFRSYSYARYWDIGLRKGSVLGVEIEASSGSYDTRLVKVEDAADVDGLVKSEYGGFLKPDIFTLKIPKVGGGSNLLVKARWSQKLVYNEGYFLLNLPFSFPVYVLPAGKISKRERIQLSLNTGLRKEVVCRTATHPLKELKRQVGKIDLLYEEEVHPWSQSDFEFLYTIYSSDMHGGVLLQSPSLNDLDQREMFALYLFPGDSQNRRVFRKRVVFLVDISGSMKGAPIENVKKAMVASLSKLNQDDFFNIIAFNGEIYLFSSSMELATPEALRQAGEWMTLKLIPEGDTNILLPLNQALEMVSDKSNSMPFIFLITDGAVENERDICNVVKDYCTEKTGLHFPRVSTFGLGSYCNHYFLQMLAQIGRGHYDAAYDADSAATRLQRLFTLSSSVILSDVQVDWLNSVELLELYPSAIQDLSCDYPMIISGRCRGNLPESLKVSGTLADLSNFTAELKIRKAKDVPLDKVFARRLIHILTANAWFTGNKEIEKQVAEISMQTGFPSEYTRVILVQTESADQGLHSVMKQEKETYDISSLRKMISGRKIIELPSLGTGFGDLKKTAENLPPGVTVKEPDAAEWIVKTATGCCSKVVGRMCCMCFIQALSQMSNQCVITLSQLCGALACCECLDCCYDLCVDCL
ncbi:hypothetical protein Cgig2_025191 [Carnegiea gigantea]|uniref:VWFA domain-containing protein n=1 Tax=Carnegiea gigantea TaxID=171969 RepID=A0A9Q1KRV8_9CARY|nr:hypothetical protein Cgig2_025191 [Carnegiea gigantea]